MVAQQQAGGELSSTERRDLARLEEIVGRGLGTFWEVGKALEEIAHRKLYRMDYPSFEDYCQERWAFSRRHAYRLIGAAEVMDSLAPSRDTGGSTMRPPGSRPATVDVPLPSSEKQARPLSSLPPEQRGRVWHQAVKEAEGGQPRTKDVAELVAEARAGMKETTRARFDDEEKRRAVQQQEEAILRRSAERQERRERETEEKEADKALYNLRQAARHAGNGGKRGQAMLKHIRAAQKAGGETDLP